MGHRLEDLAADLANVAEGAEALQSIEEAQAMARALAVLETGVLEALRGHVAEFARWNGPVAIDEAGDSAYAHWEQKNTVVRDEAALWAWLTEKGSDPEHYKRPDIAKLKAMVGNEAMEGLEEFVAVETSTVFGRKANLLRKPKAAQTGAKPGLLAKGNYRLGPRGVTERAVVVRRDPGPRPGARRAVEAKAVAAAEEAREKVAASCGIMPLER